MKKNNITIQTVKNQLVDILGKEIKMQVNKGRNKLYKFEGMIENLYPSVFTFKTFENEGIKSFSYSEILCGAVKIKLKDKIKN